MQLTSSPPTIHERFLLSAEPIPSSSTPLQGCPCPSLTTTVSLLSRTILTAIDSSTTTTSASTSVNPPTVCVAVPSLFDNTNAASTSSSTDNNNNNLTTLAPISYPRSGCGRLLPEECLEWIFEHLADNLSALHSLILVSTTFFRIAMPLLYASPFDLLESDPKVKDASDTTRRHAALIYLLLNCRSQALAAAALSSSSSIKDAQLEPEREHEEGEPGELVSSSSLWANLPPVCETFEAEHEALKRPLVDYLSAYNHHHLCMNLSSTFRILFPNIQRHALPSPPPSASSSGSSSVTDPQDEGKDRAPSPTNTTVTTFTRNEIERTFLLHRPDLTKTISLPIQRLPVFLSICSQLSRLYRFELYGVSWYSNLDQAIDFLELHAKQFGTIQELKMAGPPDVSLRQLQKPSLAPIIRTIKNPKVIDLSRYKEATKELNVFEIQNLQGLEKLLFDLDYVPPLPKPWAAPLQPSALLIPTITSIPNVNAAVDWLTNPQSVLSLSNSTSENSQDVDEDDENDSLAKIRQCTNLTHLQMGINSADAFAWAVKWTEHQRKLMPLKVLNLSSNKTLVLKVALEDSLLAFQHTLESIKAVAIKLYAVPEPSLVPPTFGWSWNLSRLCSLSLRGEIAAWFELESLRYCPLLTDLNMTLHPYTPPKPGHLDKIIHAPKLTSLALAGRLYLSDEFLARLSQGLPKLSKFCLDGCQCDDLTTDGLRVGLESLACLEELEIDLGVALNTVARVGMTASRPNVKFSEWNTLQAAQK